MVDLGLGLRDLWGRRCPSCRRSFRIRPRPRELSGLAREAARRLPHANANEIPEARDFALCPYCGRSAEVASFLTRSQDEFLDAASAWVSALVTFEQLAFVERTIGQNPYQTFYAMRPVAPERPAMARGDLRPVPLGCCGAEIDLDPAWLGEIRCPYCMGGFA
ncbi:MAG: TFIIB-type zinc ribbon-containing protein [Myxococcales bacterium]